MHLYLLNAVALARLAAPSLDIEGEAPGLEAALSRILRLGKQIAYIGKHTRVGCGI